MAAPRATLVADVKASLGESPVWHERSRTVRLAVELAVCRLQQSHSSRLLSPLLHVQLYHVDINGKKVWSTRGEETALVATLAGPVGCVVPRASGGLLACLDKDIVHVDVTNGAVSSPLASVPADHSALSGVVTVCVRHFVLMLPPACHMMRSPGRHAV